MLLAYINANIFNSSDGNLGQVTISRDAKTQTWRNIPNNLIEKIGKLICLQNLYFPKKKDIFVIRIRGMS